MILAHDAMGLHEHVLGPILERLGYLPVSSADLADNSFLYRRQDAFGIDEITGLVIRTEAINRTVRNTGSAESLLTDLEKVFGARLSSDVKRPLSVLRAVIVTTAMLSQSVRDRCIARFGVARTQFWDIDDVIGLIDRTFPEIWTLRDVRAHTYLQKLMEELSADSFHPQSLELTHNEAFLNGSTDGRYIDISTYRLVRKLRSFRGQSHWDEDIERVPALKLRDQPQRLISLIGDAGSGKSTAIRRLAYLVAREGLAHESPTIPVIVRAVDIMARPCESLIDCAYGLGGLEKTRRPFTEEDLTDGRVMFLIDGLDEVPDDTDRARVLRLIKAFNRGYPDCRVIVTTRNYSSIREMPDFHSFTSYTVDEISIIQAESLVRKLLKPQSEKDVGDTVRELFRRLQEVHGVELSPLLVAVFVATADSDRTDVPANITEMFKKWTELMLGRWDKSKGFSKQYHAPLKDHVVMHVALTMHKRRAREIERAEFDAIVTEFLRSRSLEADSRQILSELDRSGLFRRIGARIEFRHHMLQEFFAGRALPSIASVAAVIGDEWWRMPVVFYFGEHPGDADALAAGLDKTMLLSADDSIAGAITIGLALQAAYLTTTEEKKGVLRRVIGAFASGEREFLARASENGKYPWLGMAWYFWSAHDAVALGALKDFADELLAPEAQQSLYSDNDDTLRFWTIIGLIETAQLAKAEQLLKAFRPKDQRFLIAIDMCLSIMQHVKISQDRDKNHVKRIRKELSPRIERTKRAFFKEVRESIAEEKSRQFKAAVESHAREKSPPDAAIALEISESSAGQPDSSLRS